MNTNIITSRLRSELSILAERITSDIYDSMPELRRRFGEKGYRTSLRDMSYHLEYLIEALELDDASLFTDYIAWTAGVFEHHGLSKELLRYTLTRMQSVLDSREDDEEREAIHRIIEQALSEMEGMKPAVESYIDDGKPHGSLLKQYTAALLRGERQQASSLVEEALDKGTSVKELYLQVFQPSQYEIGRLWMTNAISVAEEHYCTAATQLIMSRLYPRIFSSARRGLRFVACCVGGELHEIGMRMVADFFELEGWDTYYLGANTPVSTLNDYIESKKPDVLGLSMTLAKHRGMLTEIVEGVRRGFPELKIIAGGYAFLQDSTLAEKMGLDGFAPDAEEAVTLAESLV